MGNRVFLGIPCGAGGSLAAGTAYGLAYTAASSHSVTLEIDSSSALTMNFNKLWACALDRRARGECFDRFAMMHSDVLPGDPHWLDTLLGLLDEHDADVVSAIIPIKDEFGLTSTAFDTDRWRPRRLTMREAMAAPETFDGEYALREFGAPLLLNTGLWVCRLDRPWVDDVVFDISNRIVMNADGFREAQFEPEDWKFSRWCNSRSLKLVATRKVKLGHLGHRVYSNDGEWGIFDTDRRNAGYVSREPVKEGVYVPLGGE